MVSMQNANRAHTSISLRFLVPLLLGTAVAVCQPTTPPSPASSLLDTTRLSKPATPEPKIELTPEGRGDVFMARKMYREAIDSYRLGPQNSALTWNKIGIAYHQLLDLRMAQKNYEKALKLDPKYSEADARRLLENLGSKHIEVVED